MTIRKTTTERLLAADDTPMQVQGATRFTINGTWIRALVSKSLYDDILLSWRDMKRLHMIPPDFPEPQQRFYSARAVSCPQTEADIDNKKQSLLQEFTDVFSDELPKAPMEGPLMTCLLYTSPSPRDRQKSRMPSSA